MNLIYHKIITENSRRLCNLTTKAVLVMALSFILVQSFVSLSPAYAPPMGSGGQAPEMGPSELENETVGQAPEMGPSEPGQAPEMGPSELENETVGQAPEMGPSEPGQAPEMGPSELENETVGQAPEMGPSELENST